MRRLSFPIDFPQGFQWGASVSPYQHFGPYESDMPPVQGAMHRSLYREDIEIFERLGLKAFRTSVEWALLEPHEGFWNSDALSFYKHYLGGIRDAGLNLILGLHHFTNPSWIQRVGGWRTTGTAKKFLRYVERAVSQLGDFANQILVFNEPNVYATLAYYAGVLPPFWRNNGRAYLESIKLIVRTIKSACEIVRAHGLKVGVPYHVTKVYGIHSWNPVDQLARLIVSNFFSWKPLLSLKEDLDFVGINYYVDTYVGPGNFFTKLKPESIQWVLEEVHRRIKKPILVTETGIFTRREKWRMSYLFRSLLAVNRALEKGIPIQGYLWWSFLHGYEWGLGYEPFTALVDTASNDKYRRIITPLAKQFSQIAMSNRLLDLRSGGVELPSKPLFEWRYDLMVDMHSSFKQYNGISEGPEERGNRRKALGSH